MIIRHDAHVRQWSEYEWQEQQGAHEAEIARLEGEWIDNGCPANGVNWKNYKD